MDSYEANAACTSLVTNSSLGCPVLGRTLDWPMPYLQDVTIDVTFIRSHTSQSPLFRCTTFVGYIGVLTACKPGVFGASINFRSCVNPEVSVVVRLLCIPSMSYDSPSRHTAQGSTLSLGAAVANNLAAAIRGAWPVSFLLRHAMERVSKVWRVRTVGEGQ